MQSGLFDMLASSLFGAVSPAGKSARLAVLIFHRVLPEPDPLFPHEMDARRFGRVCGWIKSWFNVLPLDKAVQLLQAGDLPARAACITFDDGYADNHDVALPILASHGLPATFFIATGFLDGGRMWNDTVIEAIRMCRKSHLDIGPFGAFAIQGVDEKRHAIDRIVGKLKYLPVAERVSAADGVAHVADVTPQVDLMMTSSQVKAMRRAGMQIGAHTVSHPILAGMSEDRATAEIKASKEYLERLLGDRVGLFAYPNGKFGEDYNESVVGIVRRLGFDAAVSTEWGASRFGDDLFQIRRFTPWDTSRLKFGLRMLANLRRT